MIKLERITKFNIEEKISALDIDISEYFFGKAMVLENFLNRGNKELYVASQDDESYLVMFKLFKMEYRFLFSNPKDRFLNDFSKQFDPRYIGVNLLEKDLKKEVRSSNEELTLEVDKVLNLENAGFRKDYNRALKHNSSIEVSKYEYKKDVGGLLEFLEEWRFARTEVANEYAHIENDINFLTSYGREPSVCGVVVRDTKIDKIIAYCLFVPQTKDVCISIFSKILRGYENLGVFLTFEKCKQMKEEGFQKANLGSINNDFKKSLKWAGKTKEIFSAELSRFSKMKFRTTAEEYLALL